MRRTTPSRENSPTHSASQPGGQKPHRPALTRGEFLRYGRHLLLPEVGEEGQRKLKGSSVLIVGAGGLGSPLALYLAAAGVGRIGLVDFDAVEVSNLQRQILFSTDQEGRSKLDAARERLQGLNPSIAVETIETRLSPENAVEILQGFDVVADGTDNFPARFLVNDTCARLGKPDVYGSVFRFEGQVSVFWAGHGACYRCLHPELPPAGAIPSCAEAGVMGVLPGIIGTIQAAEVLKLLLGIGSPLVGQMLLFDGLAMEWRKLTIRRNPWCMVCGDGSRKAIRADDYEAVSCSAAGVAKDGHRIISAEELRTRIDSGDSLTILDVREPVEYAAGHLPGAIPIPIGQLPFRLGELDRRRPIVVHCKSGGRSALAAEILRSAGFQNLLHFQGGIAEWKARVDPEIRVW